jgi:hypothetical protein
MIKTSINTWYVPQTIDQRIVDAFTHCINGLGLDVKVDHDYDSTQSMHWNHGAFMDRILRGSSNDVEVFVDVDVLLFERELVEDLVFIANENQSIGGLAHCVGHTPDPYDIFVGSPLVAISVPMFQECKDHSCIATVTADTCKTLNEALRAAQRPIQAIYPIGYDFPPIGYFGNYSLIGRGIHYPGAYHLLAGGDEGGGSLRADKEKAIQRFVEMASRTDYQLPATYGIGF